MTEYCVDAVRYAGQDLRALRIGPVAAGKADSGAGGQEVSVDDVVARIEANDIVRPVLREDGRTELGPRLKVVTTAGGRKTLALDSAQDVCLELSDLDRF